MFKNTLAEAVDAEIAKLTKEASFDTTAAREAFATGGIPYPEKGADRLPCKESHFELTSYKGKGTRKWGHITVWRHESGRYEGNSYIL